MSKRQKIGMLLIALVLSMAMALGSAFAADDDVITTKSLVSTGSIERVKSNGRKPARRMRGRAPSRRSGLTDRRTAAT